MSIERAQADLDRLSADADRLRGQLHDVEAQAAKVRTYIEMARQYAGGQPVTATAVGRGRPATGGISGRAVAATVEAIKAAGGKPIHTRELLVTLAQQGIEIGGNNPIANLSGFLSRSDLLTNSRASGWRLAPPPRRPLPSQADMDNRQPPAEADSPDDPAAGL